MIGPSLLEPLIDQVVSEHISNQMNYSISIVTIEATMAVVPLLLPPVLERHKIEKKNGDN